MTHWNWSNTFIETTWFFKCCCHQATDGRNTRRDAVVHATHRRVFKTQGSRMCASEQSAGSQGLTVTSWEKPSSTAAIFGTRFFCVFFLRATWGTFIFQKKQTKKKKKDGKNTLKHDAWLLCRLKMAKTQTNAASDWYLFVSSRADRFAVASTNEQTG